MRLLASILFILLLASCNNQNKNQGSEASQHSIEERGIQIAQTTQAELGKNLMAQIKKNGNIVALQFCNIKALPLTDSMAQVHKAHIKRITDKPRNPKNKANAMERQHIQHYKNQVAAGREIKPIVTRLGNEVEFYYPIVTNAMCLNCHGTPKEQLEPITFAKIRELYPEDQAINYSENEVRGIWSIRFKK